MALSDTLGTRGMSLDELAATSPEVKRKFVDRQADEQQIKHEEEAKHLRQQIRALEQQVGDLVCRRSVYVCWVHWFLL